MAKVFSDQDAVILCLNRQAMVRHSDLAKASVEAGVKRLITSDYGGNHQNAAAQKLFPTFQKSVDMINGVKSLETPGWSWTSIICGLFFEV
jgi:hypothetical protein